MRVSTAVGLALCIGLPACQLSTQPSTQVTTISSQFCLSESEQVVAYNCDLDYWLQFWIEQDKQSWSQRKTAMQSLPDDISGQLKRILMSQAKDTPYQDRLRAQIWAEKLLPQLTESMQQLLTVIVYQPSQAMLEYESALSTLSRVNSRQSEQLQQQQSQIEAFMKIEASIVEAVEEKP